MAASIQAVTEEIVLRLTRSLAAKTGQKNLCLAGGVALNCVANGKVLRDGNSINIWIQPAAGDAGGALGAALATYYLTAGAAPCMATADGMHGSYLGPSYERRGCRVAARQLSVLGSSVLDERIACRTRPRTALADGQAVGWFQGRMEFGPRALGARSILGDPRSPTMQKMLNLKVKYRETFRPFAPAVLREHVADWFELDRDSPYMLLVAESYARAPPRDDRGGAETLGHRSAQCRAVRYPGGDACRLFGAHPDGARRDQSAVP